MTLQLFTAIHSLGHFVPGHLPSSTQLVYTYYANSNSCCTFNFYLQVHWSPSSLLMTHSFNMNILYGIIGSTSPDVTPTLSLYQATAHLSTTSLVFSVTPTHHASQVFTTMQTPNILSHSSSQAPQYSQTYHSLFLVFPTPTYFPSPPNILNASHAHLNIFPYSSTLAPSYSPYFLPLSIAYSSLLGSLFCPHHVNCSSHTSLLPVILCEKFLN